MHTLQRQRKYVCACVRLCVCACMHMRMCVCVRVFVIPKIFTFLNFTLYKLNTCLDKDADCPTPVPSSLVHILQLLYVPRIVLLIFEAEINLNAVTYRTIRIFSFKFHCVI